MERPTGRTFPDLLVDLLQSRYLRVVVGIVVTAFVISWAALHAIAEPGSEVSVWGGLLKYTKRIEAVLPPEPTNKKPSQPKDLSSQTTLVVEFSTIDTHKAPGQVVAAAPYLHRMRVSVEKLSPVGSELVIINNRALYEGRGIQPESSQNVLTQIGTGNTPASFVLKFSQTVRSVSFTRPALFPAAKSGITHPAWSAHALDANGRTLSSQSESLIRSYDDVSARTYTLNAPGFDGITAVRFESDPNLDGKPFAAFSALLIESLRLVPKAGR